MIAHHSMDAFLSEMGRLLLRPGVRTSSLASFGFDAGLWMDYDRRVCRGLRQTFEPIWNVLDAMAVTPVKSRVLVGVGRDGCKRTETCPARVELIHAASQEWGRVTWRLCGRSHLKLFIVEYNDGCIHTILGGRNIYPTFASSHDFSMTTHAQTLGVNALGVFNRAWNDSHNLTKALLKRSLKKGVVE